MANSFIPVDDKYYNSQLVGKVFIQVETDPDTQVETTHYIMETLGGQRKEIPQEIFDDIVNGEYTPGGVTVDDQLSDTSENPVQNKVIYRQIQGVAEMAEGKSAAYVVDDEIDTAFNSQDNTITINSSFTDINIGVVSLDKLKIGDVIYVTETDVPDRWVQTITKQGDEIVSVTLGKMETAKVPVLDVQVNKQSVVTDGVAEITVDSDLDPTSENPVQNKVVTEALSEKASTSELALKQDTLSQSSVDSGTPTEALGFDGNGNLVRGAISGGTKLYRHSITITNNTTSIYLYMFSLVSTPYVGMGVIRNAINNSSTTIAVRTSLGVFLSCYLDPASAAVHYMPINSSSTPTIQSEKLYGMISCSDKVTEL